MRPSVVIDGELVSPERATVSVFDRGFLYGDSAFEVLRTYARSPTFLHDHLARLERACATLSIPVAASREALAREVERAVEALALAQDEDAVVRVVVTRGRGAGLEADTDAGPTRVVTAELLRLDAGLVERGLFAIVLPHVPLAVPGVKSGSYLANVMARRVARAAGADEAVLVEGDRLIEGAGSNVFGWAGGRLFTAPETAGVLAGVTRAHILRLAAGMGLPVSLEAPRLAPALDEVFVTSAVRGVAPICRLVQGDATVYSAQPGQWPKTARLKAAFERLSWRTPGA